MTRSEMRRRRNVRRTDILGGKGRLGIGKNRRGVFCGAERIGGTGRLNSVSETSHMRSQRQESLVVLGRREGRLDVGKTSRGGRGWGGRLVTKGANGMLIPLYSSFSLRFACSEGCKTASVSGERGYRRRKKKTGGSQRTKTGGAKTSFLLLHVTVLTCRRRRKRFCAGIAVGGALWEEERTARGGKDGELSKTGRKEET